MEGWWSIGDPKEGHGFEFYPINVVGKWGICMCVVGMLVYMVHLILFQFCLRENRRVMDDAYCELAIRIDLIA